MTMNLFRTGCVLCASSVLVSSVFASKAQAQLFPNAFLFEEVTFEESSNAANIRIELDDEGNIILEKYTGGKALIENASGKLVTSSTTFNGPGGSSLSLGGPTVSKDSSSGNNIFSFNFLFEDVTVQDTSNASNSFVSDVAFTYQFDGEITSLLPTLSEGIQTSQTVIDLFGIAGNTTPNSSFPIGLDVTRADLRDALVSEGPAPGGKLIRDSDILFTDAKINTLNSDTGTDEDTRIPFEPLNDDIGEEFFEAKGTPVGVPEPTSILSLLGVGSAALAANLRKKRTTA
ncbi:MAG: PEP-CTERM sorting domain-containing protein [Cyanobacteria bacterium P01_B01_bin.77]